MKKRVFRITSLAFVVVVVVTSFYFVCNLVHYCEHKHSGHHSGCERCQAMDENIKSVASIAECADGLGFYSQCMFFSVFYYTMDKEAKTPVVLKVRLDC